MMRSANHIHPSSLIPYPLSHPFFKEARAAQNRTTLRRIEGNSCVRIAFGAMNGDFDSLSDSGFAGGKYGGDAFVFCIFAITTAFWRICQPFVAEKHLFADSPNKLRIAVNTEHLFIEKFFCFRRTSAVLMMV